MANASQMILQLVLLAAWTCLSDTPVNQKNVFFARFFPTHEAYEAIAISTLLLFSPGLLEALQSPTPPAIEFFKSLPHNWTKDWGVYVLVLEKAGERARIYVGSATNADEGLRSRYRAYKSEVVLPRWVEASMDEGFIITHKGILCRMPLPSAVDVPAFRLFVLILEGWFAYAFWAMRNSNGSLKDWGMGHTCLWDRSTLEYDGLCGHCALNEGITGDFDLTAKEIEHKASKRKEAKRIRAHKDHVKNMEHDYEGYRARLHLSAAKTRAKHPGIEKRRSKKKRDKAKADKRWYCKICDMAFRDKHDLRRHEDGDKHFEKVNGHKRYQCVPCQQSFFDKKNFNKHMSSKRHLVGVAAAERKHSQSV